MYRYRKAVFFLPIAVLCATLGCQNADKSQKAASHPTVRIAMDANNPIPSCFASSGWVTIPGNGTVDWTADPSDTNSYQVLFGVTPYPLVDSSGTPVNGPIVVDKSGTQSGTNKGPFTVSAPANYACKAKANASQCYFSYDIQYNNQSCVQHYGSGYGIYSSGLHVDR